MKLTHITCLFILIIFTNSSTEAHYGRFWRGEEQKDYSKYKLFCDKDAESCFEYFVNQWLIPATPSYAARDALTGYAPVLLPRNLKEKYQDEFALILYENKMSYDCLRGRRSCETPLPSITREDKLIKKEGLVYGPIHGEIFDSNTVEATESNGRTVKRSRSLVPKRFDGRIKLEGVMKEVSYDLMGGSAVISNLNGGFFIRERSEDLSIENYLSSLEKTINLISQNKEIFSQFFILINENYFTAFLFSKKDIDLNTYLINEFGLDQYSTNIFYTKLRSLKIKSTSPLQYDFIQAGQGGILDFTIGVKPGDSDHPLLPKNVSEIIN